MKFHARTNKSVSGFFQINDPNFNFNEDIVLLSRKQGNQNETHLAFGKESIISGHANYDQENWNHTWFGLPNYKCKFTINLNSSISFVEHYNGGNSFGPFLKIRNIGNVDQVVEIDSSDNHLTIGIHANSSLEISTGASGLSQARIFISGESGSRPKIKLDTRDNVFELLLKDGLEINLNAHLSEKIVDINSCKITQLNWSSKKKQILIFKSTFENKISDFLITNHPTLIEKLLVGVEDEEINEDDVLLMFGRNGVKMDEFPTIEINLVSLNKNLIFESKQALDSLKIMSCNFGRVFVENTNVFDLILNAHDSNKTKIGGFQMTNLKVLRKVEIFKNYHEKISVDYFFLENSTIQYLFDVSNVSVVKDISFDGTKFLDLKDRDSDVHCLVMHKFAKENGNLKEAQRFFSLLKGIQRNKKSLELPERIIDLCFDLISRRNESLSRLIFVYLSSFTVFTMVYCFCFRLHFIGSSDGKLSFLANSDLYRQSVFDTVVECFLYTFFYSLGPASFFINSYVTIDQINPQFVLVMALQQIWGVIFWFLLVYIVRNRFKIQ